MSHLFNRLKRLRKEALQAKLGELTSLPANYIDELDKENHRSLFGKIINHIKRKAVYVFAFLPLLITDWLTAIGLSAFLSIKGSFQSGERKQQTQFERGHYTDLVIKTTLSLLGYVMGLVLSPKLISFYFVKDELKDSQLQSGGKLYEAEVEINKLPAENATEELARIIQTASQTGRKITVRGAGMSQGKQFLPEGRKTAGTKPIVIDLNNVKHIQLVDREQKVVRVGAGATWADVQLFANQHAMAVKVMQASNVFSIGGSIGTNIHGWDHRTGTVAQTIRSVTVVSPQGEIHTYRRGEDGFNQVFGTFGMLGMVTEVELELTDNEVLYERAQEIAPDEYVTHFENEILPNRANRMHLYRLSLEPGTLLQSGVSVCYVKEDESPAVVTANLQHEGSHGSRFERIAINFMRRSHTLQGMYWRYERKRLLSLSDEDARQTTNDIMHPVINAMFNGSGSEAEWLQEYFIPGSNLPQFLTELGQLLDENNVHMINATVRYVPKDDISPLPYAPEARYAVVLCFNQVLKPDNVTKTERWIRLANQLAIAAGGSFYMPYQQFGTVKQYEAAYGRDRIESFRALKRAIDPDTCFASGMHAHYITPKPETKENIFKTLVDSPEHRQAFRGFLENVLCRVETDKFFALLDDVTRYCDTYEETYQVLQSRIAESMPGTIGDLKNILHSLTTIKTDLVAQAQQLLPSRLPIEGMLEIGYPGRFIPSFAKAFTLTGPKYAMFEGESLTDYIQSGFPRPYDRFFKLDYDNPTESMKTYLANAGENSVEVITCFVGLHHFPEAQLDEFLSLLRRALKPGGHFLLVDHNVQTEQDWLMAELAHSVFNVVTGAKVEEDMVERRYFKPMAQWQAILAAQDLGSATVYESTPEENMIRNGDPSRNQMCVFRKATALEALHRPVAPQEEAVSDDETLTATLAAAMQVNTEMTGETMVAPLPWSGSPLHTQASPKVEQDDDQASTFEPSSSAKFN